jgi:hypothetical protein
MEQHGSNFPGFLLASYISDLEVKKLTTQKPMGGEKQSSYKRLFSLVSRLGKEQPG